MGRMKEMARRRSNDPFQKDIALHSDTGASQPRRRAHWTPVEGQDFENLRGRLQEWNDSFPTVCPTRSDLFPSWRAIHSG